ncbi:MAG: hypothetical protein AB7F99_05815, partial [Vicinamibacterales bacterium]
DAIVDFVLARVPRSTGSEPHVTLMLRENEEGLLTLHCGEQLRHRSRSAGTAGRELLERLLYHLSDRSRAGMVLHAAALSRGSDCILFPGQTGSGKTTLSAWFAARGFTYLTDELVCIPSGTLEIVPFTRPLNLRRSSLEILGVEPTASARVLPGVDITLLWPDDAALAPPASLRLTRLVFPRYQKDAGFEARPLSKAEAGLSLISCLINARNLEGHGFADVTLVASEIPAFQVTYGNLVQVDEWLNGAAPSKG